MRPGTKVRYCWAEAYPAINAGRLINLSEATGEVKRVIYASECRKRCCARYDVPAGSVCTAEVWWTFPDGSTSYSAHKPYYLSRVLDRTKPNCTSYTHRSDCMCHRGAKED